VNGDFAFRVAVVGATGLVGAAIVSLLEERSFPVGELLLYGSEQSSGEEVEFGDRVVSVRELERPMRPVDVAFLCATEALSRELAEPLASRGAWVIDLAAHPPAAGAAPPVLDVAEARRESGARRGGIVRLPDPRARMIVLAVRGLASRVRVKRVIATLLVPASAFGKDAVDRLSRETVALLNLQGDEVEQQPASAFRCSPEPANGPTRLIERIESETACLLRGAVDVAVNAVRAPMFFGEAASVSIELESSLAPERAREALREAPSLVVPEGDDEPKSTLDVLGTDGIVVVGLRRRDEEPAWLHFWMLADGVRQGAALAAVGMAEGLLLGGKG
jgi:aspartate-semialdehyde dehydrogenase